jgi:hypothetical protein
MESLLLFRRALPSPTMCRFIPALSVPESLTLQTPCRESPDAQYYDFLAVVILLRFFLAP